MAKKDLALILGIGAKPKKKMDDKAEGDADDIRSKSLEAAEQVCDAVSSRDAKGVLKAFSALHSFEHALWDMDEEMADEDEGEEDLEDAESEEEVDEDDEE